MIRQQRHPGGIELPKIVSPARIASASATGTVLTVNFDQPVILKGTPEYEVDVPLVSVVSAELTSPMTLEVTYSGPIDAATTLTIPWENPSVRTNTGGFVADTLFTL